MVRIFTTLTPYLTSEKYSLTQMPKIAGFFVKQNIFGKKIRIKSTGSDDVTFREIKNLKQVGVSL